VLLRHLPAWTPATPTLGSVATRPLRSTNRRANLHILFPPGTIYCDERSQRGNRFKQRRTRASYARPCKPLNDLVVCLSTRYNRLRQLVDLDEAIITNREALQYRAPRHPDRFISTNNLAICLSTRYDHLGRLSDHDLEEAVAMHRDWSRSHPNRSVSLSNLAIYLVN
jgi:hypothetical protein